MNAFNPVTYTMEMKIFGFGLIALGLVLLLLVVMLSTHLYDKDKPSVEDRRD